MRMKMNIIPLAEMIYMVLNGVSMLSGSGCSKGKKIGQVSDPARGRSSHSDLPPFFIMRHCNNCLTPPGGVYHSVTYHRYL